MLLKKDCAALLALSFVVSDKPDIRTIIIAGCIHTLPHITAAIMGFMFHSISCLALCRYVTAKDMTHNVVYVSRSYYEQHKRRDAFVCGPFNWLSQLRPNPGQLLMVKVRHGPNMYSCSLQLGLQEDVLAHAESAITAADDGATSSTAAAAGAADTAQGNSNSSSSMTSHSNDSQQHKQQQQQQLLPSFTGEGQYGLVVLSENDQGLAAGQYAVFYQGGACLGSAQMLGSVAR
jgi:tRNA-specific 2-thiouridylase